MNLGEQHFLAPTQTVCGCQVCPSVRYQPKTLSLVENPGKRTDFISFNVSTTDPLQIIQENVYEAVPFVTKRVPGVGFVFGSRTRFLEVYCLVVSRTNVNVSTSVVGERGVCRCSVLSLSCC